jgi:hypothetical protein
MGILAHILPGDVLTVAAAFLAGLAMGVGVAAGFLRRRKAI